MGYRRIGRVCCAALILSFVPLRGARATSLQIRAELESSDSIARLRVAIDGALFRAEVRRRAEDHIARVAASILEETLPVFDYTLELAAYSLVIRIADTREAKWPDAPATMDISLYVNGTRVGTTSKLTFLGGYPLRETVATATECGRLRENLENTIVAWDKNARVLFSNIAIPTPVSTRGRKVTTTLSYEQMRLAPWPHDPQAVFRLAKPQTPGFLFMGCDGQTIAGDAWPATVQKQVKTCDDVSDAGPRSFVLPTGLTWTEIFLARFSP